MIDLLNCFRPEPIVGNPDSIDYISEVTGEIICSPTLDASIKEQRQLFKAVLPYTVGDTIQGDCYIWDDNFIKLCRIAMSTDSLAGMSSPEKILWTEWVNYEERASTSADESMCSGKAIGCTILNEEGISYAVCKDGTISTDMCTDGIIVPKEDVLKSLDETFMQIYNCEDYGGCAIKDGTICIVGDSCSPDGTTPSCPN